MHCLVREGDGQPVLVALGELEQAGVDGDLAARKGVGIRRVVLDEADLPFELLRGPGVLGGPGCVDDGLGDCGDQTLIMGVSRWLDGLQPRLEGPRPNVIDCFWR
jgi:hypothetical protein